MSGWLVDTNVISEILRAKPDERVAAWCRQQPKESLFISVISLGELQKGITLLPQGARRSQLEALIVDRVPAWFWDRVLPVTQSIAERWGALDGQRQLVGRPLNVPDGQIAATALEHGLTVVTRNGKDFEGLGAPIINPWEAT